LIEYINAKFIGNVYKILMKLLAMIKLPIYLTKCEQSGLKVMVIQHYVLCT